jgi:hypothetical protein
MDYHEAVPTFFDSNYLERSGYRADGFAPVTFLLRAGGSLSEKDSSIYFRRSAGEVDGIETHFDSIVFWKTAEDSHDEAIECTLPRVVPMPRCKHRFWFADRFLVQIRYQPNLLEELSEIQEAVRRHLCEWVVPLSDRQVKTVKEACDG